MERRKFPRIVCASVLIGVFALANIAFAATTIGTDISTDGNLTVSGLPESSIPHIGNDGAFAASNNFTYLAPFIVATSGNYAGNYLASGLTMADTFPAVVDNDNIDDASVIAQGVYSNFTIDLSTITGTALVNGGVYVSGIASEPILKNDNAGLAGIYGFDSHPNIGAGVGLLASPTVWLYHAQPYISNGAGPFAATYGYDLGTNDWAGASIGQYYGFHATAPTSATISDLWMFYSDDLAGSATNPYYSWFDSRGVRRVKEDPTIDGVGQAVEALYNNLFTKYTPGATDYERVVLGQWNSNVAEIGTQAGGSGTLRPLRLLGSQLYLPGHVNSSTTNSDFDGTIAISSATSASHTFATAFNSAPVCTLTPTSDPNSTGRYWVTASASAVTANVSTSGTITFNYHCVGNPN